MVDIVIGTRPEAIKLSPVIKELAARKVPHSVITTGQHLDLLDSQLKVFGISPTRRLQVFDHKQSLNRLTSQLFEQLGTALGESRSKIVVAQGDTTSVLVSAVTSFYQGKKFFHVEAGLRSGDIQSPFPEEFNRRAASLVCDFHFAPTPRAFENLKLEGVSPAKIRMTGNTVVDALKSILPSVPKLKINLPRHEKMILVTAHRRENMGEGHKNIFRALRILADQFSELCFLVPLHPNPKVREIAVQELTHPKIVVCEPLDYLEIVSAMLHSTLILTDSGGIQEEAPTLKKPVLVLRETTERPELIESSLGRLIGTSTESVVAHTSELLQNPSKMIDLTRADSPFGDGMASSRIVDKIIETLEEAK